MGIGPKLLVRIQTLCQRQILPPGARVLDLGAQEIFCKGHESFVHDFHRFFSNSAELGWKVQEISGSTLDRLADQGFSSALFRACGFHYDAFDIFDGDGVTLFDLNLHSPSPEFAGQFDLVTNFGTTEHLINQYQAMRTIHELVKVGGVIHHDLPMGGYHTHGYFSYNPMLFRQLASSNNYEILYEGISCEESLRPAPEDFVRKGWPAAGWSNRGIEVVLRKTSDRPFVMPLEMETSLGLNPSVWNGEDPYGLGPASRSAVPDSNANYARNPPRYHLSTVSGWDLQNELARRYIERFKKLIGTR